MPCLGARRKPSSTNISSFTSRQNSISNDKFIPTPPTPTTTTAVASAAVTSVAASIHTGNLSRHASIASHQSAAAAAAVAQIKQECSDLKSMNKKHLEIITKQTEELAQLRKELSIKSMEIPQQQSSTDDGLQKELYKLESRHKETISTLAEKEALLEETNQRLQELLMHRADDKESPSEEERDNEIYLQLEEKDRLLQEKDLQLEELKAQWNAERAELIKPALQQVTAQLEELKETNKIAVDRLSEKENELAELRSQLTRRDRKPKQSFTHDQDNQRRLNRLTMDLENDRLLIQRLDELNQQLEAQKQNHETILESHAKVIAEKDHALLQQQKSLKQLKINHENATKTLEQEQLHHLKKLQLQHETDMNQLNKRLKLAENQAKSTVDDELDQILVEFEQSQHNHSIQVAHLQQSYQEQISVMKQGQQAELQSLIGSGKNNSGSQRTKLKQRQPSVTKLRDSKFQWPPAAPTSIAG
ncbi:uncharacterized protein EV154DRAFT_112027 [Mucor mucedo]|uniref:uncharacterized protein n=1 Tax=Mucor mucedo TaxID=29922 RepID=UPI0022205016|nr:uncharacterized protein EV154DRAFT_112027 [Mucor mucedo]KAI7871361.1 hypothetical protein EV154DRAFT_112027 [Mucor mucedo]